MLGAGCWGHVCWVLGENVTVYNSCNKRGENSDNFAAPSEVPSPIHCFSIWLHKVPRRRDFHPRRWVPRRNSCNKRRKRNDNVASPSELPNPVHEGNWESNTSTLGSSGALKTRGVIPSFYWHSIPTLYQQLPRDDPCLVQWWRHVR